jgi:hypothetical protein
MTACGAMVNAMVKVGLTTITVLITREIGQMMLMTDLESKHGRKDTDTRGNLLWELDKVKDNFSGLTAVNMRAILIKTELRATEF